MTDYLERWLRMTNDSSQGDATIAQFNNLLNLKFGPLDKKLDSKNDIIYEINKELSRTGIQVTDQEKFQSCLRDILVVYSRWDAVITYIQGFHIIIAFIMKHTPNYCDEINKIRIFNLFRRIMQNCKYNLRAIYLDIGGYSQQLVDFGLASTNSIEFQDTFRIILNNVVFNLYTLNLSSKKSYPSDQIKILFFESFLIKGWCFLLSYIREIGYLIEQKKLLLNEDDPSINQFFEDELCLIVKLLKSPF